jgi:aryl-alcohol dehydrogenase-like predicted oxidoreductase
MGRCAFIRAMTHTPAPAALDPRPLGRSGLEVSALCLGGNVFGWTIDERRSFEVLDAFVEGGGTFIDTADVYSVWVPDHDGGESERIIGRWLAARGARPEGLVIATKVGAPMPDGWGLGREHVVRSAERSIARLGVDAIDLYYAHRDDTETPLEETLAAFDELVQRGLVRAIGASNYDAARLGEALATSEREGLVRYEALQPIHNLLDRDQFEGELQHLCVREQIGVAPYYALAAGFLTGKYPPDAPEPDSARATSTLGRYGDERGWRVVHELGVVARELEVTEGQVAIAWLAAQPGITAPIASATSRAQVEELLAAARLQLDEGTIARLTAASAP